MKRVIFASLWLTVASYLCITALFGSSGLTAHHYAAEVSRAMEANIRSLQVKNTEYKAAWNRLIDSPEMIAREGRSLGYLSSNEVALTIKNKKKTNVSVANPGYLLIYTPPAVCQDKQARLYALLCGASVLVGYLLFRVSKKLSRKKTQ